MIISLLAAIGKNNELGGNNMLLWKIRDDMKLFKEISMGHAIIMGRKTFESLGKPLPGRKNIVVTSHFLDMEGVYPVTDLNYAIEMARESDEEEAVVIGGAQIFNYAIDLADKMYLSHVDGNFPDADVFFPEIDFEEWEVVESRSYEKNERNEFDFEFRVYIRK